MHAFFQSLYLKLIPPPEPCDLMLESKFDGDDLMLESKFDGDDLMLESLECDNC